jgi:hypothetical protein
MYFDLTPAYGRNYKTKAEVIAAWETNLDFEGDYSLGFKPVNREDIPKPCTVRLRYQQNRKFATVEVGA